MIPEPFSRADIEEMRTVVAETDVPYIRVKREVLERILSTPYRTPYRDHAKPEKAPAPPKKPPSERQQTYNVKHNNKRIAEFESQHPTWIVKELGNDQLDYSKYRNAIGQSQLRYARIQVSLGTVRYYTPDQASMDRLMRILHHEP